LQLPQCAGSSSPGEDHLRFWLRQPIGADDPASDSA
jgi:hypothetical protein